MSEIKILKTKYICCEAKFSHKEPSVNIGHATEDN